MQMESMAGIVLCCAPLALGNVFDMPPGLTSLGLVTVGNPGNAGELSGDDLNVGPKRVCGAVGYVYDVGKYEVTAGQYCEFLNAVAKTDTYTLYNGRMDYDADPASGGCNIKRSGTSGSYSYDVTPHWANRPVNYVSYWDACRFANWLHNGQPTDVQGPSTTERGAYTLDGYNGPEGWTIQRNECARWVVPSEDEWYKAAYHKNNGATGDYWDYPTSSDTAPGRDMADAAGNNANFYDNGFLLDSPYYRTEAGEFENSDSPYGTFDQGGNVYEWNESIIYNGRSVRGGSLGKNVGGLLAPNRYFYYSPSFEAYTVGFRIVGVPEPAALLLTAAGMLTVRRRRLQA